MGAKSPRELGPMRLAAKDGRPEGDSLTISIKYCGDILRNIVGILTYL